MQWSHVEYRGIRVAYDKDLDGGGRGFGQQYLHVVRSLFGPVKRACEFGAGPGFIGFSLLAHDLCETLCLTDVNPKAIEALHETVAINGLQDRVSVYESDALDTIPESEQWDLVVANPPHFRGSQDDARGVRQNDPDWEVHARFYTKLSAHLKPHGNSIFQENTDGSSEADFLPLLENTDLEHVGSFMTRFRTPPGLLDPIRSPFNSFYFFWVRKSDPELVWRAGPPEIGTVTLNDEENQSPLELRAGNRYLFDVRNERREAGAINYVFKDDNGEGVHFEHRLPGKMTTLQRDVILARPMEFVDTGSGRVIAAVRLEPRPDGSDS